MSKSFAEMLNEGFATQGFSIGSIIKATVVDMNKDFVWVDAGLKSECAIPVEQFKDVEGNMSLSIGDQVDVALEAFEDSSGETKLSRAKAERVRIWNELEQLSQEGQTIKGKIINKVKGGFTVDLGGVRAFLPGSLVDVRPLKDTSHLEVDPIDVKVIKIDQKRNNIVVSRRAVVEEESSAERETLLGNLAEGQIVKGVVKNLTDYGAFIDLGGIDGLLHITDISWSRIRHPSEMIAVGDELTLVVLRFDAERGRVSLGLKQLAGDPWDGIQSLFPVGSKVKGRVTNIADYGCFIELKSGVEGLVHVSEMDWTNKNVNPHKVVQLGGEIEVMILEVDMDRRRISLGLKQCVSNPWERFSKEHARGDAVKGKIKSITDFGIFLGLPGDIDGLIHLSDLSWTVPGEVAVRDYKKGDEIDAVVLTVDADRERISLGIKQMTGEGLESSGERQKGSVMKGTITAVDDKKGVDVDLGEGVVGHIRRAELSRDRIDDITVLFKVGAEVEAAVVGVDKKTSVVNLSVKAMTEAEEKEALRNINKSEEKVTTTLGDLIKEKMGKTEE